MAAVELAIQRQGEGFLRGRRVKEEGLVFGKKKADCAGRLERCRSRCGWVVF